MAAPFNGGSSYNITPTADANFIRAEYMTSADHGDTWRSGYYMLQWSSDGGTTYYGLSGASQSAYGSGTNFGSKLV